MVSKFDLPVSLTKTTNTETLEKYDVKKFQWGNKFPMYVKKYMSKMVTSKPTENIVKVSSSIFVNKNTRPTVSSNTLREQNYITTEYDDSPSNIGRVSVIEKVNGVTKIYVPKGARFRFKFLSGKLSKPVMETASIEQTFTPMEKTRDASGGSGIVHDPFTTNAIILTNNTSRTTIPGLSRGGAVIEVVNGQLLFNGYDIPETN